jgi:hypothetical protein
MPSGASVPSPRGSCAPPATERLVDVRTAEPEILTRAVGSWAEGCAGSHSAEDDPGRRPVEPNRERKSIGLRGDLTATDLTDLERIRSEVGALARLCGPTSCSARSSQSRTVVLKLRYSKLRDDHPQRDAGSGDEVARGDRLRRGARTAREDRGRSPRRAPARRLAPRPGRIRSPAGGRRSLRTSSRCRKPENPPKRPRKHLLAARRLRRSRGRSSGAPVRDSGVCRWLRRRRAARVLPPFDFTSLSSSPFAGTRGPGSGQGADSRAFRSRATS